MVAMLRVSSVVDTSLARAYHVLPATAESRRLDAPNIPRVSEDIVATGDPRPRAPIGRSRPLPAADGTWLAERHRRPSFPRRQLARPPDPVAGGTHKLSAAGLGAL